MSDRLTVYSLVKKSDWIYTKCKIEPNTITLFNNLVVTPCMLYNLYYDGYICSLFLVWFRAYLDGLDGYIARKFNKCSKIGEIYDHFSDCLYTGALATMLMSKVLCLQPYSAMVGYAASVTAVVCDYDERYHWIAKFAGAGGNEDGYSFLIPYIFVTFTWCINILGLIGEVSSN